MANCGMYPCGRARAAHRSGIFGSGDELPRKRTKTEEHKDVPTVTYKLWPATAALLRKHRAVGELALTNEDGGPLQRKWIDDAGKGPHKTCNITSAVKRAIGRLGLDLSIAQLRKTSAEPALQPPDLPPMVISCSLAIRPARSGRFRHPAQRRDSRRRDPMVGDSVTASSDPHRSQLKEAFKALNVEPCSDPTRPLSTYPGTCACCPPSPWQ